MPAPKDQYAFIFPFEPRPGCMYTNIALLCIIVKQFYVTKKRDHKKQAKKFVLKNPSDQARIGADLQTLA